MCFHSSAFIHMADGDDVVMYFMETASVNMAISEPAEQTFPPQVVLI